MRCRPIHGLNRCCASGRACGCPAAGTDSRSRCGRSSASRSAWPRRVRSPRAWRRDSANHCRPRTPRTGWPTCSRRRPRWQQRTWPASASRAAGDRHSRGMGEKVASACDVRISDWSSDVCSSDRLLRKRPGLRLPSGWDGFEIAVRAILGQQVSVAAARTFATRVATRFGEPLPAEHAAHGLAHLFPTPAALADADLASIGITRTRAQTIRTIARALLDDDVDFRVERTLDDFVARWTALPGIGPWTAHYIALRALGPPAAFPAARSEEHTSELQYPM